MSRKRKEKIVKAKRTPAKEIKAKLSEEELCRQTGKSKKYAYVIIDKYFGEFFVLNTANAWWLDRRKVEDVIAAYKIDCTNEEAQTYAGISKGQMDYFRKTHKEFSAVISACRQLPTLTARKRVVEGLPESFANAMDYLERKRKNEFAKKTISTTELVEYDATDKEKQRVIDLLKKVGEA